MIYYCLQGRLPCGESLFDLSVVSFVIYMLLVWASEVLIGDILIVYGCTKVVNVLC